jgi:hypothetical protein
MGIQDKLSQEEEKSAKPPLNKVNDAKTVSLEFF